MDRMIRSGLVVVLILSVVFVLGMGRRPKKCAMCTREILPVTEHRLTLTEGSKMVACCSHCGLMLEVKLGKRVKSAQATDFSCICEPIYCGKSCVEITKLCREGCIRPGKKLDARKAYYVKDSDLTLCCSPSIMAFATQKTATTFQATYGGKVLTYWQITTMMKEKMRYKK